MFHVKHFASKAGGGYDPAMTSTVSNLDSVFEKAHTLRWLYIDFNSYFASVEQQLNPALRGRPIAVVPVETDATCAIAASYEAKAYGIKTGTPIYEAKQKCPGLICVPARHEHYVRFHQMILAELDKHLPVSAVCSIDEMACRLMDNETDPARIRTIADGIKRGLAQEVGEYVRCSIGVAANQYLAKVATDLQKPDGFTIMAEATRTQQLLTLKLRDLPGIGHNMEKRLHMAGIYDMASLLELSPRQMRAIWGSIWGEKMWYLLRGADLPAEDTSRSTIGHSHVMAPQLRDPLKARYVAKRLTMKAASRLRRLGYLASAFSLSMRIENGGRLSTERRCYRAQDTMTFLALLDEAWQELMQQARGGRIKKLSVVLFHLSPIAENAPLLPLDFPDFDSVARGKHERVSRALDKINHRFGRDSVLVGMLPSQGRSFSGTKVAFTRIPDVEEFFE
ncbi:MAG: impB/mucB/samB family protein [Alphaproteobacteria bacterium]|nr:impB/mucB/samB family protein [Alphaproteobacteria bacterium]